ncbi:hypothetical protein LNKW23_17880 [Paralimibaculum aggregatum]|uniref:DUF4214 domain-containing protein n=1 Tax=Paralimibaculum aggregatum TaxID=3036245 RepID=A0ABQ6LH04_9RHOB|nr:DUF4214 domain-containing protein [Limibaculum sp. NKW23]GMG82575.1 hypothetical protein LNKW23_17880 [Limibaculum sp. NKW23]
MELIDTLGRALLGDRYDGSQTTIANEAGLALEVTLGGLFAGVSAATQHFDIAQDLAGGGPLTGPDSLIFDAGLEEPRTFDDDAADAFVGQLYRNAFGREADAAGLDYWSDALAAGDIGEHDLIAAFVLSPEAGLDIA